MHTLSLTCWSRVTLFFASALRRLQNIKAPRATSASLLAAQINQSALTAMLEDVTQHDASHQYAEGTTGIRYNSFKPQLIVGF